MKRRALLSLVVAMLALGGIGGGAQSDASIEPFTINVPESVLADLKARLKNPRIPEPLQGDGWELGTDTRYLRELVDYWRDRFDWRAQERRLNAMEQFTTSIDGLTLHFVHRKSKQPDAMPLLVTHGWPGSFAEFTKIIGPLTDPVAHGGQAGDAFHVVMPSIPGFTFSGKPREPGWDPARIAALEAKLMARLGYGRYGAQGGDWGAIISTQVALADPTRVAGLHLNMCIGGAPPGGDPNEGLTPAERERLKVRQAFQSRGDGVSADSGHQAADHRHRPQRLARRTGCVDRGEVPDLVRLRRQPRDGVDEGRAAHQHHVVLGDANRGLVGPHLLREPPSPGARAAAARRDADGLCGLPEGNYLVAAPVAGAALQHHALDRDAARRPFRGDGAATVAGGRHSGVFSRAAIRRLRQAPPGSLVRRPPTATPSRRGRRGRAGGDTVQRRRSRVSDAWLIN